MTTQGFFEILGEMDDRIVSEEADRTGRGRRNIWKAAAAVAACLALVVCAAVRLLPGSEEPETFDKSISCDIAPMVYVEDTLYLLLPSGDWEEHPQSLEGLVYLGSIQSVVTSCGQQPRENFQANDSILGCEVYRYGSRIAVKVDGHYLIYEPYGQPEVDRDALSPPQKAEMDPGYKGE